MKKSEAKKRVEKLKAVIAEHRFQYHVLDKQTISDAALDSLKHEFGISASLLGNGIMLYLKANTVTW